MNLSDLTQPLPQPVNPFTLLAVYLEKQQYPDQAALQAATQQRDQLLQLAAQFPNLKTNDPQLALLIAGCGINPQQRATVMALCSNQEALDVIWALPE